MGDPPRSWSRARPDRPLVVLVDDIHWAEPTLLDLLAGLPAAIVDAPILAALPRPARAARAPARLAGRRCGSSRSASATSTRSLDEPARGAPASRTRAARAAPPPATRCSPRSSSRCSSTRACCASRAASALPATSTRSSCRRACTRCSALASTGSTRSTRAALERGAIEGEVFHRGAVVELSEPSASRPSVPAILERARRQGPVRPAEPSFAGEAAYRFKHILVRDTAYRRPRRGSAPRCTSSSRDWLERIAGERVTEYEEILGYHLEQSYRLRPSSAPTTTSWGCSAIALPATSPPPHTVPARAAMSGRRCASSRPPPSSPRLPRIAPGTRCSRAPWHGRRCSTGQPRRRSRASAPTPPRPAGRRSRQPPRSSSAG